MIKIKKTNVLSLAGETWVRKLDNISSNSLLCITSTGRIITGTVGHGVWYSDDNGETWVQVNIPVSSGTRWHVYIAPTGRIIATSNGSGSYYSDDNGNNWHYKSSNIYQISFCTTSTGRIIIGTDRGIWRSDSNYTTISLSNKSTGYIRTLCVTPTGRIIAGTSDGIWYSDDDGLNWVQSNSVGDEFPTYWSDLCVTPTGRILASSHSGIWYSDDNGVNWTRTGLDSGEWYALCVTPTGRILAGNYDDGGIWYSDDNGVNWTQSNNKEIFSRCLLVTPTGRIIAGSNGSFGPWYSDDNGVNWTQSSRIYRQPRSWYSLCATPTGRLIMGSNGIGIWYSDSEYSTPDYTSKPLTGKQAKELVQQCKAYVQALKNGN